MIKNSWKKLNSKIVYKNPWLRIREDKVIRPDGKQGIYGVIETLGPSVFIVALTNKDEIHLIGQYRYTTKMYSWEVPGGNSENQNILQAAKRELKEETGLEAKNWQKVGTFQTMNGTCSEIAHVFIARELNQTKSNEKKEEGITKMKKVSFKTALEMVKTGKITDGQSISALMQVAMWLDYIQLI